MQILTIYGSSRRHGNSEQLTERLLEGLPATRIYLSEWEIPPIADRRHAPGGFPPIEGPYNDLLLTLLQHDYLIFATTLYWYGMSGDMKRFVDLWSHAMRDERYRLKEALAGKEAFLVVTGSDDARRKALPLVQQFGYICDFMGMKYAGYLIGQGNKPGEVLQDARALAGAAWLNQELRRRLSGE